VVRDWENWDSALTSVALPNGKTAFVSQTVTMVEPPLVTFESCLVVEGESLVSTSTLRFRERDEVVGDLATHGFEVLDVRDAPDRPGKEFVFVSRRTQDP
jgi:hypothetical protein